MTVPPPTAFSILRAEVVPPYGGNTLWGNTAAAYAELPDALKLLAENLRAELIKRFELYATARRRRASRQHGVYPV